MRIAVMCSGYGLVPRGVETFLHDLMPRLRKLRPGWSFDVYTRAPSGWEADGIRLIHVPAISRDSKAATLYAQIGHRLGFFLRTRIDAEGLSFAIAASSKLALSKYDLIFNQAGPFMGWFLALRKPFGFPPIAHKTASGYSPLELIMKRQRPDLMIATSPFVENWLRNTPPETPVVCIPNGVDCDLFHPRASEAPIELQGLQRPIVLFIGAIDPMKRPELAIDAMAEMGQGSLVMIGDGILREQITASGLQRLGPSRFLSLPYIPHGRLPDFYRASNVFTLPSEEPFGIVFLEALACNTPIVANRGPVQSWIVQDAGLTCNCENPAYYAAALHKALTTNFGNRPRLRAEAFDWDI
ncbi:MAG: glycosyltransferase family 4 protein, partial [Armatimonadota bacterium]|nr:glycosyltransferase family 4 protein [Armatimonadota bacterium]